MVSSGSQPYSIIQTQEPFTIGSRQLRLTQSCGPGTQHVDSAVDSGGSCKVQSCHCLLCHLFPPQCPPFHISYMYALSSLYPRLFITCSPGMGTNGSILRPAKQILSFPLSIEYPFFPNLQSLLWGLDPHPVYREFVTSGISASQGPRPASLLAVFPLPSPLVLSGLCLPGQLVSSTGWSLHPDSSALQESCSDIQNTAD